MTTFLNIGLLVLGTFATLAAFGGKTWRDGDQPVLERITVRGWISLLCLMLALCLGTIKEVRSQAEEARKALNVREDQIRAEKQQEILRDKLSASEAQTKLLNQKLDEATAHLSEAKSDVDDVRKNLGSTRDDLTRLSTASLVSAFRASKLVVKQMVLYIPLSQDVPQASTVRDVLLPGFSQKRCQDYTGAVVSLEIKGAFEDFITIHPSDRVLSRKELYGSSDMQDLAGTFVENDSDRRAFDYYNDIIGQKSANHSAYELAVNFDLPPSSSGFKIVDTYTAASFLEQRYHEDKPAVEISSVWPDTKTARDERFHREVTRFPATPRSEVPCEAEIHRYFMKAFRKAAIILVLDTKDEENIFFGLKASSLVATHGGWTVQFYRDGPPIISTAWLPLPEFDH